LAQQVHSRDIGAIGGVLSVVLGVALAPHWEERLVRAGVLLSHAHAFEHGGGPCVCVWSGECGVWGLGFRVYSLRGLGLKF